MLKNSSGKYYQKQKGFKKKKLLKGFKISPKKRKTRSDNMVVNDKKISQNTKNKG